MSKAVLISIHPEWTRLIVSGQKTIEVRKTRPKLETPFKCYIYETKGFERVGNDNLNCIVGGNGRGSVIGEFVCDYIYKITAVENSLFSEERGRDYQEWYSRNGFRDCLSDEDFDAYLNGKSGYGWHISELKIYDEPKKLSEFAPYCEYMLDEKQCDYKKVECLNQQDSFLAEDGCNCLNFVRRPPQSWCYIEEIAG